MPAIQLSLVAKTARSQALANQIDEGGTVFNPPELTIYTDPQPAVDAEPDPGATALVTIPCPYPFAATVSNGTIVADTFDQAQADAAGTATWARLKANDGDTIADFTVGGLGSGANIELTNTLIFPGVIIIINSFTITEG